MPVREITPSRLTEHADLISDLASEWSSPSQKAEPVIFIERDSEKRLAHVYVVWSRWADLDRVVRSELVMDAAERVLPADEVLNITIAMGLTPEEANRLGIKG